MSPETRLMLASCAGSALLLLLFVLLVMASAALFLVWRGLRVARQAAPEQLARIEAGAARAHLVTHDAAVHAVAPQVRLASGWIGLKAGWRALRAPRDR
jgi:hypothetical protein